MDMQTINFTGCSLTGQRTKYNALYMCHGQSHQACVTIPTVIARLCVYTTYGKQHAKVRGTSRCATPAVYREEEEVVVVVEEESLFIL